MPQLAIYIETKEPVDHEVIQEFLVSRGNQAIDVRDVSVNEDGLIITDTLMHGHWNHGTGQARCTGQCANTPREHIEWEQLSPSQQQSFATAMANFMLGSLNEYFAPDQHLEDDEEFDTVALTPC